MHSPDSAVSYQIHIFSSTSCDLEPDLGAELKDVFPDLKGVFSLQAIPVSEGTSSSVYY